MASVLVASPSIQVRVAHTRTTFLEQVVDVGRVWRGLLRLLCISFPYQGPPMILNALLELGVFISALCLGDLDAFVNGGGFLVVVLSGFSILLSICFNISLHYDMEMLVRGAKAGRVKSKGKDKKNPSGARAPKHAGNALEMQTVTFQAQNLASPSQNASTLGATTSLNMSQSPSDPSSPTAVSGNAPSRRLKTRDDVISELSAQFEASKRLHNQQRAHSGAGWYPSKCGRAGLNREWEGDEGRTQQANISIAFYLLFLLLAMATCCLFSAANASVGRRWWTDPDAIASSTEIGPGLGSIWVPFIAAACISFVNFLVLVAQSIWLGLVVYENFAWF